MDKSIRLSSTILLLAIFVAYSTSLAFSQQPKRTAGETSQVQPQPTSEYMIGQSGRLMRGDSATDLKSIRNNLQELKDEKGGLMKKISEKKASEHERATSQRSQGGSGNQKSTLENLNLQEKMNRQTKAMQTQSNIVHKKNQTDKAIVRKIP